MTATVPLTRITSPLAKALEDAWESVRKVHPDLPPVVAFAIGSGTGRKAGESVRGHFAASRWGSHGGGYELHEILIAGERLADGADGVMSTLLHESCHALAHVREIHDTSRGGRYHNKRFAALAREVGLDVAEVGKIGWSDTTMTERTRTVIYAATLRRLAKAITSHRRGESMGSATGRTSNNNGVVLVCPGGCSDPARKIRVSLTVAEVGPIWCGECSSVDTGEMVAFEATEGN